MSPTFERLKKKRAGSTVMPLKKEQQQLDEHVEQPAMLADFGQSNLYKNGVLVHRSDCTIFTSLIWVRSHNVKDNFTQTNKLILRESVLHHPQTPLPPRNGGTPRIQFIMIMNQSQTLLKHTYCKYISSFGGNITQKSRMVS